MTRETIKKTATIGSIVLSGILLTLDVIGLFKGENKAAKT